jgi:hypothetical protein
MAVLETDQALALAIWLTGRIHPEGLNAAEALSEILDLDCWLGFEPEP